MATSTQQKQELFKAIWATAEDLRNSVDGWDFKSYVLGILFYRFISENITNYINSMQRSAGMEHFDYSQFSDEEAMQAKDDLVREKGFFILPSQLFRNGEVRESGTGIAEVLPPMGLFGNAGAKRAEKKQNVIRKFKEFFERFFDISGGNFYTLMP